MYNQIPQNNYNRVVYPRNEKQLRENNPKELVPGTRLGSAKTEIAEKGIKFAWKNFKNFFVKLFKGDKEIVEHINDAYNVYDGVDKVIDSYSKILPDSSHNVDLSTLYTPGAVRYLA